MSDDLQSKAADLVRKALTVGVGAYFLTEESLRGLVSELKLPKELLAGILDSANRAKNDFLQNLSQDVLSRLSERVDLKALVQELLETNEIDLQMRIRLKPRKAGRKAASAGADRGPQAEGSAQGSSSG
jgi:hypothetical protein